MAAGKNDSEKVSVIWETPEYRDYNWKVRDDADQVVVIGPVRQDPASVENSAK